MPMIYIMSNNHSPIIMKIHSYSHNQYLLFLHQFYKIWTHRLFSLTIIKWQECVNIVWQECLYQWLECLLICNDRNICNIFHGRNVNINIQTETTNTVNIWINRKSLKMEKGIKQEYKQGKNNAMLEQLMYQNLWSILQNDLPFL